MVVAVEPERKRTIGIPFHGNPANQFNESADFACKESVECTLRCFPVQTNH